MIEAIVFVFGAVIGSFLNVCIHRMPREESIISPPSHCPACKQKVAWKDNLPLISYLILKGKCRHCQSKISIRYFVTELFTGCLWLGTWLVFGQSPFFILGIIYLSILIAVTITDLETQLIPDKLSLTGMVMALILCTIFPVLHSAQVWYWGFAWSFIGLLAGGGIILTTTLIANAVFKKESMGGGDIKLLAMIGAFVGWKGALFSFFFSPFLALPIGLYVKFALKKDTIAFGPYLALAGAIYLFYRQEIDRMFFYF